jgi:hypothetical protein
VTVTVVTRGLRFRGCGQAVSGNRWWDGGVTWQLQLALGVADAVQAHTGGVHLDALFIDESFGTVDPDSLQLAMDELDRLCERIRSGIEVLPIDHGSTLRVGLTGMPGGPSRECVWIMSMRDSPCAGAERPGLEVRANP